MNTSTNSDRAKVAQLIAQRSLRGASYRCLPDHAPERYL